MDEGEAVQIVGFADDDVPAIYLDQLPDIIENEISFESADNESHTIDFSNLNYQSVEEPTDAEVLYENYQPDTVTINAQDVGFDTNMISCEVEDGYTSNILWEKVDTNEDGTNQDTTEICFSFSDLENETGCCSEIVAPLNNEQCLIQYVNNEEMGVEDQPSIDAVDYNDTLISTVVPAFEQPTSSNVSSVTDLSPTEFFIEPTTGDIAIVSQVYLDAETIPSECTKLIDLTQENVDSVEKIFVSEGIVNQNVQEEVDVSPNSGTDLIPDVGFLIVEPLRTKTDCPLGTVDQSRSKLCNKVKRNYAYSEKRVEKSSKNGNRRKQILRTIPGSDNLLFEVLYNNFEKTPEGNKQYESNVLREEIDEIFGQNKANIMIGAAGSEQLTDAETRRLSSYKRKFIRSQEATPILYKSFSKRFSYVKFDQRDCKVENALSKSYQAQSTKCDICGKIFKALRSLEKHKMTPCSPNVWKKETFSPIKLCESVKVCKKTKFEPATSQMGRPMTRAEAKRRALDETEKEMH